MNTIFLPVDNTHTLAIYRAGNPAGLPIIYLHGGPGGGCELKHFDSFDLDKCFVILFDQRGCGRSTPFGCLENNTTWDLVEDIEKIRQHFQLNKVLIYGGSWGSTLALAYTQTHPQHVLGLVLRSICLARKIEADWLYEFGANQLFPDAWSQFRQATITQLGKDSPLNPSTIVKHYCQQLLSGNPQIIEAAALAWNNWAGACLEFPPMDQLPIEQKDYLINLAKIETHYFSHQVFLEENQLLENLVRIQHLKAFIVHGAKDFLCPVANAYTLHRAWPDSVLTVLPNAGHLSSAPGMQEALQAAVRRFY
jgi:proline iminopeptidase